MLWLTSNFKTLIRELLAIELRTPRTLQFLDLVLFPLDRIRKAALYKTQHNGIKISLEKVLNEEYSVPDYDPKSHELTKQIYIENRDPGESLYIYQPSEFEVSFMEDDGTDVLTDLFLEDDFSGDVIGFIIFIPDTIEFDEIKLRNLFDSYRFLNGKQYTIEIYTL